MKVAIVMFNLGGPDSPEAVEPFLRNLFSDPAIISLPGIVRLPLARLIARRRAPVAREIYHQIGGRSPIVPQTEAQAHALETVLAGEMQAKAFIAMRCWHPMSDQAARAVKDYAPDRIVLLPLYPQYSTTTSASSLKDWARAAGKAGLSVPTTTVCCYPAERGFVRAMADHIRTELSRTRQDLSYRLLLSAHGLPKRTIARGDPYQWQVEQTARAIAAELPGIDWQVCYQSRVGPLEWIGPATDAEIRRAGAEGKGVIVAPVAFVSEHSETLVELDIEYAMLARESGVPDYRRAATAGVQGDFIAGLAGLVRKALAGNTVVNDSGGHFCPAQFGRCGFGGG
jgi:ferrochelatase